jgi:hypothetical protein
MFLRGYLSKLCSYPSTTEFWQYPRQSGYEARGLRARAPFTCGVRAHWRHAVCHAITSPGYSVPSFHSFSSVVFLIHSSYDKPHTVVLSRISLLKRCFRIRGLRWIGRLRWFKALSEVIWIQKDLFAKWYVRDGEGVLRSRGEHVDDGDSDGDGDGDVASAADAPVLTSPSRRTIPRAVGSSA